MLAEIILIFFCALVFSVHYRIVNRNYYKLVENFESIGPLYPIIGHLHLVLGKSTNDIYCWGRAIFANLKKTATVWIFSKLFVVLITSQDIQTVLNSNDCLEKASPYKLLMSGNGLITAHPIRWKSHRRLLNTSFSLKSIMTFVPQMNELSCNLVKDLEGHCDQGEILLLDKIGIRIIDTTVVNFLNYNLTEQSLNEIYQLVHEVLQLWTERMVNFCVRIIYYYVERLLILVSKDKILEKRQLEILDEGLLSCKQKYMPEIEEDARTLCSDEQFRNQSDRLLKRMYRMIYHNRMTQKELEENIVTILYAGTDTTTRALGNIILCLAMNSEIQEKLYTELNIVLGDVKLIDYETIMNAEYLDRVIKESLRYLPLIPFIGRRANKNIQLEHGIIPAGTDVIIPIENIHKSESIWGPNYNKFDPDHFLPENCEKRYPCSFIPFSYGPRNCIGYRYAQISLKITIANLVRTYKFGTSLRPENLYFGFGITAKLLNDYRISVTKRNDVEQR